MDDDWNKTLYSTLLGRLLRYARASFVAYNTRCRHYGVTQRAKGMSLAWICLTDAGGGEGEERSGAGHPTDGE